MFADRQSHSCKSLISECQLGYSMLIPLMLIFSTSAYGRDYPLKEGLRFVSRYSQPNIMVKLQIKASQLEMQKVWDYYDKGTDGFHQHSLAFRVTL